MHLQTIIRASRGPFLLLTPVCLFLAYALAHRQAADINLFHFLLICGGALCAHLSVNFLNEYQDFSSGLDLATNKTPFSGGSGALVDNPQGKQQVLMAGLLSLSMVLLTGVYFIATVGWQIMPFGLLGMVIIVTYTHWINRIPLLCLIAPGLGFGLLMVLLGVWLLTGHINITAVTVALIPFFQINNLLLLNQLPDIDADRSVGRRHAAIVYGVPLCATIYLWFMLLPFGLIAMLLITGMLPLLVAIALLPLPLGILVAKAVATVGRDIGQHHKYLAMNVALTLTTPLLLALGLLLG